MRNVCSQSEEKVMREEKVYNKRKPPMTFILQCVGFRNAYVIGVS